MGQPYVNFALIRAVAGLKLAPPRLVASTRASTHASDNGIILERRFDNQKVGSAKKSVLNVAQNVCRRGKQRKRELVLQCYVQDFRNQEKTKLRHPD